MAPRWRELREAYPRIVTGTVVGIAVLLLLTDLVLAYKRAQYGGTSPTAQRSQRPSARA